MQHHETPDNTKDIKFDFTAENYKIVNDIIANYPANYKASAVIPVLDIAQQQHGGWIPLAAMDKIAEILGMAPIRVYEVATFYSMFNRSKVGKYYIQVCSCVLSGSTATPFKLPATGFYKKCPPSCRHALPCVQPISDFGMQLRPFQLTRLEAPTSGSSRTITGASLQLPTVRVHRC